MKMINMTPHAITIKNSDINITVEPCGVVARVTTTMESKPPICGGLIPIVARTMGEVDFGGMEATDDTIFLVSSMVLDALNANHEFASISFAPDTGASAERNDKGHILSVCQLVGK